MTKFASINTFEKDDLNALFEVICTDIIGAEPMKVKQEKLGLEGSKKEIEEYPVSISDILNLITIYGIKFNFKINYEEKVKADGRKKEEVKKEFAPETPKKDLTKAALDEQKRDLKVEEKKEDVPPFDLT